MPSKFLYIILNITLIAFIGFIGLSLVMPGHEIVIDNQKTQLTSSVNEKEVLEKGSTSNISQNVFLSQVQLSDFSEIKTCLLNSQSLNSSLCSELKNNFFLIKERFIEIDLDEMKIRLYEEGKEIKEFPILTKGNPESWSGVPVGLHSVISKHEIAFSNLSKVYMPYSIQFQNRYFLHGEPYYPGGQLLQSQFTSGCIRFLNKYAKEIYDFAEENMPILITDKLFKNNDYKYPLVSTSSFPEISAKSYLIADIDNGFILSVKNPYLKLPIASLTKLMTAIVAVENINFEKTILVTQEMIEPFESNSWFQPKLKVGERYGVLELIYPLLTESSNDVAEALSYFLGKEKTLEVMNKKAKSITMINTEFVEPSGLDEKNISTVQDLFYLGKYILSSRSPLFKITKNENISDIAFIRFGELRNKNILFDHPNFIGGKTGYISEYTGLFLLELTAKKDYQRKHISIILLGSNDLENDLLQIFEWLKENYFIIEDFKTLEQAISPFETNSVPIASLACKSHPTCQTSNCIALQGCLFHFENNSIDPDNQNSIIKSEWDILDWGVSPDLSCDYLCNFTPQTLFMVPGSYKIKLYIENKRGASDEILIDFLLKEK